MAIDKKQKESKKPSVSYEALKDARVGSKKDGSAKLIIKKGDKLKDLSEDKVKSYRLLKIIK